MTPRFRQHLQRQGTNLFPLASPRLARLVLKSTWDPDNQHSGPDVSQDTGHYYWIPQLKFSSQPATSSMKDESLRSLGPSSPIIIFETLVCNYYNTKMGLGSQWKIWGELNMKDYLVKNQNIIQIISAEMVINSKYFHFFAYLMCYQMKILYRVIIISMSSRLPSIL